MWDDTFDASPDFSKVFRVTARPGVEVWTSPELPNHEGLSNDVHDQ
jgi:hypothetical protein